MDLNDLLRMSLTHIIKIINMFLMNTAYYKEFLFNISSQKQLKWYFKVSYIRCPLLFTFGNTSSTLDHLLSIKKLQGVPKKVIFKLIFAFLSLGGVFLGVKNNSKNFGNKKNVRLLSKILSKWTLFIRKIQ